MIVQSNVIFWSENHFDQKAIHSTIPFIALRNTMRKSLAYTFLPRFHGVFEASL